MSKWLHRLPKQKKPKQNEKIADLDKYRSFLKLRRIVSIVLAGCAVIALVVILAVAFFTGKFTEFFYHVGQISASDSYPVTIKEQSFVDAAALDRYIAVMTKNGVIFLDEKGQKADEAILGYSSPVLRSNNECVLVYDHSGTQFRYIQPFHTGYAVQTDQKIITGALSKNGNAAIATYSDRYAAEVSVYNKNGIISYRWYSASDKVIGLSFSEDGEHLYVSCINAENGFIQTILYALNLKSEKEVYRTVLSAAVAPYYLQTFSNQQLAIITSGDIEFIDEKGVSYSSLYYYSDLLAVCGSEKYLAAAQQNINNNTTAITIYNAEGTRIDAIELADPPLEMTLDGTDLYCLTENELLRWNFAKNEVERYVPKENCSGMVIQNGEAYLYSNNTISRVTFQIDTSDSLTD